MLGKSKLVKVNKNMGKKVNPKGFRISQNNSWESRWFVNHDKNYRELLYADFKLRETLMKKLKIAGVSKIEIERAINRIDVIIYVAKPGMVIGHGGQGMEDLKKYITEFLKHPGAPEKTKKRQNNQKNQTKPSSKDQQIKVEIKVEPVKEPNLNSYLMAVSVADQLAKRMPHKRVVNQALERIMTAGAKGARIRLAGRIAGAEISRVEKYQRGNLSLGTLREKIDYAEFPSLTKSGYIGVKVWICRP